jgi:hypothetical protein
VASPATTFHICSSPAPALVKLQPAPAILSQENKIVVANHIYQQCYPKYPDFAIVG